MDLSGVFAFTQVRAGYRWVHWGSLGSLEFALGVAGFIRGLWVHSGSPWGLLGSCGVVGFTWFRPGGRWVHPEWLGSLEFALGVVGFTRVHPYGRSVYLGSLGSLGFALEDAGFIRCRWDHSVALWVVGFILGRLIHSGSH